MSVTPIAHVKVELTEVEPVLTVLEAARDFAEIVKHEAEAGVSYPFRTTVCLERILEAEQEFSAVVGEKLRGR